MTSNEFVSDKNGAIVDQLASTMAELVEQSDILLDKMKKIKEQDRELEESEKLNSPKCSEFLGSKYDEFKNSKVISIEDIKEFISAKKELDSIREKRLQLEEEAKEINEKRAILTSQVEEAYEKIVDLIKSSKEDLNKKKGMYVRSLGCNVEIIDTYIREDRQVVDSSLTEIIRTTPKIYDALYQGYSESVTKIESEPVENYSETKSLIGSLNELIRVQNIAIDSQIPLLNSPQKQASLEEKPTLVSEPVIDRPQESVNTSINDNAQSQMEQKPTLVSEPIIDKTQESVISVNGQATSEQAENKDSFINLESIMRDDNKSLVGEQTKSKETEDKVITVDIPYSLDSSDKIANSNTTKYANIVNNFNKKPQIIVLEKRLKPELNASSVLSSNVPESKESIINVMPMPENASQVVNQPIDPIANFLSGSQAA